MENLFQIMVIQLGEESYGLDVSQVRGVVHASSLPYAPNNLSSYVIGTVNIYGQCIPVIDLHRKLNTIPSAPCSMIVVLTLNNALLAFPVDKVENIIVVSSECIQPAPLVLQGSSKQSRHKIVNFDNWLLPLIDTAWVFRQKS